VKKSVGLFVSLLGLDIGTKIIALSYVPSMLPKLFGYPYGGIPIFEAFGITFSLNTIVNTGAAWGIFQGHSGLLFFLRMAVVIGLISYLLFFNQDRKPSFPLWLIVIGAIGNGFDYLAYGHVIDFFHFCFWGNSFPIFNMADCYITIGVFFLFLISHKAKLRRIS
jgi:signal peptidase II